jgi:hypothetical protein
MDKACELSQKSGDHDSKASGLQHQLDTCIFSDDEDAVDAITEKVEKMKARLEYMRGANKAWKKSGITGLVAFGISQEEAERISREIDKAYSWDKKPFAGYELTNLSANVRRLEKRIPDIQRRQERSKLADEAGGVTVERCGVDGKYSRITFADKPEYSIIQALKAAGFRWGSGSWFGDTEKVPNEVSKLVEK